MRTRAQALRAPLSSSAPLPIGSCLGAYEVLAHLGSGGCGAVFKARHRVLRKVVALKTLGNLAGSDLSCVARFQREMEAGGRFVHPHIVQAFDAGESDGMFFLAMEFVDGLDCEKLARRAGRLPVAEACEIVRQAALGLEHAHQQGLVHRDVKPSNLLVGKDGVVKVSDLGLAAGGETSSLGFSLTPPGVIIGTPDYLSPEHVLRDDLIDARSDLYSLGCTFYRLLAARAPFDSAEYDSPMKRALAHTRDDPPDIRSVRGDLPPELVALLKRMTAKDRDLRPESAAEVAASLADLARGTDLPSLVERNAAPTVPVAPPIDLHVSQQSTVTFMGRTKPQSRYARGRFTRRGVVFLVLGSLLVLAAAWPWAARWLVPAPGAAEGAGGGSSTRERSAALDLAARGLAIQDPAARAAIRDADPRDLKRIDPLPWDLSHASVPRNSWLSLLGGQREEPRRLMWPENDFNAVLDVLPERDELDVRCPDMALISLGDVSLPSYIVRADLVQTNWEGRIGLFFGYRPLDGGPGQDSNAHTAHFLTLERTRLSLEKAEYGIRRSHVRLVQGERAQRVDVNQLVRESVPPPDRTPQQLELVVRRGALQSVRWNGQELKGLCAPEVEARFDPPDYVGQIGLVVSSSQGILRNARILIPE